MPDFDFLDAIKTTEGYKWAHVLCSIFVPDITYADASRLKVAEGIMSINQQARFRGVSQDKHLWSDNLDVLTTLTVRPALYVISPETGLSLIAETVIRRFTQLAVGYQASDSDLS